MQVEQLAASELGRIREIDRSERAAAHFVLEDGELRRVEGLLEIPTWDNAEHAETLRRLGVALDAGGVLLGVRDGPRLAAVAVLGGELLAGAPDRLELVFLHVDSGHRRQGLAGLLLDEVCRRARARGAVQLYVSSSDVEPAVRFYLGRGFRIAQRPDPAIGARWPNDIALELELA